jgi:hypothetical protein
MREDMPTRILKGNPDPYYALEKDQKEWAPDIDENKKKGTVDERKEFFVRNKYAVLLENKNDLSTLMTERTKPQVNISINGLTMSEEAARKLQAKVQNIVARVFERHQSESQNEQRDIQKPRKESRIEKIKVSSNIYGLTSLDNEEIGNGVEEVVDMMRVEEEIIDDIGISPAEPINKCVFVSSPYPVHDFGHVPDWRTVNQPLPQTYALLWTEDTMKLEVKNRPDLSSDLVAVKLETASNITWEKMITAWNFRRGGIDTVTVFGGQHHGPVERIVRTGCDYTNTLVFGKLKFMGFMWYVYSLFISGVALAKQSEEFSKAFGGKELHFTWMQDNVFHGAIGFTSL